MKAVSGAAAEVVRLRLQNASFQARMTAKQAGRGDARQRQRQENVHQLLLGLGAVHAAGLEDLLGHLLEEGEQHPDHDRQVDQRVDDQEPGARVEQVQIAEDQVDRHEDADRRQHLGRQHPEQQILGPLAREEGHGVGRRHGRAPGRAGSSRTRSGRCSWRSGSNPRAPAPRRKFSSVGTKNKDGGVCTALISVLKLVSTIQKIGKKIRAAAPQPRTVIRSFSRRFGAMSGPPQVSRFLATERIRKTATILASTIAITPPADAPPTSKSSRARM